MEQQDYEQYDAVGLAELVASREASASELLATALARSAAVNPALNAIVVDQRDRAAARAAGDPLSGAFAGVPFLLKDLAQEQAGVPSSWGSRAFARKPAARNATIVDRWEAAGLVIFGRTNAPELGAKGITEPELWGPARNPWNTDHTPGGSSGGSAAAVAAGIVPCAGANDGGGSIRIPASCCGLVGLKASRGLVPTGPATGEGLYGSVSDGVVSRSVRDTAAMLDVIAGPAAESPYLPHVAPDGYATALAREPKPLRIGVQIASALAPDPHPEARAAVERTITLLEELGHHIELLPAAPYDERQLAKDFLTTWFVGAALSVAYARREFGASKADFERDTLITAALGRAISSVEHAAAIENRQIHVRRLAAFHEQYDLLLTPTTATPPPKIGAFDLPRPLKAGSDLLLRTGLAGSLRHVGIVDQVIDENIGWVPYTQLANLTGRPAISVPLHWTADGLPIGSQFVGRLGSEGLLLQLAAQLERAHPWADRRPPLTARGVGAAK